jgi:arylsulfatase A-like enzyme
MNDEASTEPISNRSFDSSKNFYEDYFMRAVVIFCCMAFASLYSFAFAAKKPNIVLMVVDDMGWKDLGCYGAKLYETPNIDQLCSIGTKYTRMYTSAPICSPARATLMTGKNPLRLKMWNHKHILPADTQKILPSYLKEQGYQTWHVGKWHLGNTKDQTLPHDLGFDRNIAGTLAHEPGSFFWPYNFSKASQKNLPPNSARFDNLEEGKEGEYLTERITEETLKLIDERDPDKSIFLNLCYYQLHNVYRNRQAIKEGKPELVEKYKKKIKDLQLTPTYRHDSKSGKDLLTSETNPNYAAMIESLDTSVGLIIDRLKEINEFDNTMFMFISDNGPTTDDVPCTPFNGGKNSTYEAGVRVPAILVWPGKIKEGVTYDEPVYLADIFNTTIDVAGSSLPTDYISDGRSLRPTFQGKSMGSERKFFWYFPDDRLHWGQRANAAIFDQKSGSKYIMYFNGDDDEMYDIQNDKEERINILSQKPELGERLQSELVQFLKSNYADAYAPPKAFQQTIESRLGIVRP